MDCCKNLKREARKMAIFGGKRGASDQAEGPPTTRKKGPR